MGPKRYKPLQQSTVSYACKPRWLTEKKEQEWVGDKSGSHFSKFDVTLRIYKDFILGRLHIRCNSGGLSLFFLLSIIIPPHEASTTFLLTSTPFTPAKIFTSNLKNSTSPKSTTCLKTILKIQFFKIVFIILFTIKSLFENLQCFSLISFFYFFFYFENKKLLLKTVNKQILMPYLITIF